MTRFHLQRFVVMIFRANLVIHWLSRFCNIKGTEAGWMDVDCRSGVSAGRLAMPRKGIPIHILTMFLLYACFAMPSMVGAATYWASPSGAAIWSACQSSTPLAGTAACSLATANSNLSAGDTVYLRGGTYRLASAYQVGINPVHSGTSASRITYANAPGETPVIEGGGCTECGWGLYLDHGTGAGIGTYIHVTGITFHNLARWGVLLNYANYNEIDHNTFYSDTGDLTIVAFKISSQCNGGAHGYCYSTHNWIHHNSFSKTKTASSSPSACVEGGDLFVIGDGVPISGDQYLINNTTIENNYFEYAGHATFDMYGNNTVFVNNILHNEPWYTQSEAGCKFPNDQFLNTAYNGKYGHRVFQMSTQYDREGNYNLIEGSRFGFGSTNAANDGADSLDLAARRVIVRYNNIYGGMNSGLMFKYGYDQVGHPGTNNRVYNNTIYHNGYGNPWYESTHAGVSTTPEPLFGIRFYYAAKSIDNVVKNNIIYDSRRYALGGKDVDPGGNSLNTISNNWLTSDGDPKFINADMTDPTSQNLFASVHGYTATPIPDLTLQSSSPAVNKGTYLTQANGSGNNSTTLIVDDAMYFQDGSWGSDLARGVTFFPDWIAIGTVKNIVQISSIDYATNTITLSSPITWTDRAPLWLYKKSDGAVILNGSGPDLGANEFFLPPVKNLRIIYSAPGF
jgi:hypothetical protein